MKKEYKLGLAGLVTAGMVSAYALKANAGSSWVDSCKDYTDLCERFIPHGRKSIDLLKDAAGRYKQKFGPNGIGAFIVKLLEEGKACKFTRFYPYPVFERDNKNEVIEENNNPKISEYQLLIEGYVPDEDGLNRSTLSLNMDTICDPYMRRDRLFFELIRTGDYIFIKTRDGNTVLLPDTTSKIADILVRVLGMYGLNNESTCADYNYFLKTVLGPESH